MAIKRTYFFNKMGNDDLARLLSEREDFYLENVMALDPTVACIRAMLTGEGMTSAVVLAAANPWPRMSDMAFAAIPMLGLIWGFFQALASLARPRKDVTLRLTSNTSISVIFSSPLLAGRNEPQRRSLRR